MYLLNTTIDIDKIKIKIKIKPNIFSYILSNKIQSVPILRTYIIMRLCGWKIMCGTKI